ncbi:hypothetical protein C5748_16720 [Phyllobacterium phragmitis]|uniref:TRAP transporter small permease protein n=1 Tax=Phyllobacterium phragmitis TaxID=2670329 RepID=A0A2S9IPH0_9HYPH|nr:TRAP transporter small permease [Phyllobacterium phragmitis]PRD42423.1 hypothetical protein C5748_16720 [Phyllobacterium phragmitis]
MKSLYLVDKIIGRLLRAIASFCLAALFVIVLANVVSRYFQIWPMAWFDEIVQALFAWMVFIGAAALWREKEHFCVDWLGAILGESRSGVLLHIVVNLLSTGFLALMTWKGLDLTLRSRAVTPILNLPVAFLYASIPIAGAVMTAYSLAELCRSERTLFKPLNATTHETKT